jgi:hypothetical protein
MTGVRDRKRKTVDGLPYTALRDAILTHPTMSERLIPLFSAVPASPQKIT